MGIVGPRSPEGIGANLGDIAVFCNDVEDRNAGPSGSIEKPLVSFDDSRGAARLKGHRGNIGIQMAAVKVDTNDGRSDSIDSDIHCHSPSRHPRDR